jgi:hypothetical protein
MTSEPRKAHLSGRFYTHRALWHSVEYFRSRADEVEEGSFHNYLAAALFGFLALEAFVNDLGERIAPSEWANDQKSFGRQSRYPGTMGKLRYLAHICGATMDTSKPPYTTILELKTRRHFLAHGRPEIMEGVVEFIDPADIGRLQAKLPTFSDAPFVKAALGAVEEVGDDLYRRAQERFGQSAVGYGTRAFRGIIEEQQGHIPV